MPRHHKVFEELDRKELEQLEEFVWNDPGRTVDECHEWLQARGYTIGRTAVANWKKEFLSTQKFAASNDIARGMMEAAKAGGTVAISDAAALQLSQMIFEQMLEAQSGGKVTTKELFGLSMALKNVVTGKRHVEKLKTEISAALAEAEKDAKAGGSAESVVNKVREILGIKDQGPAEAT